MTDRPWEPNVEERREFQRLLLPAPKQRTRIDPFGNPVEILRVERHTGSPGPGDGKKTADTVQVEVRRDPLDPARMAYLAPDRARRRGVADRPAPTVTGPGPCRCPFDLQALLRRETTRFRVVPGQRLEIRDNLGHTEDHEVLCTTVMGNANPGAPHQFMVISTRDHHLPLHRRGMEEVVDLLRVLHALTAEARREGAAAVAIIKNRGPFAGGTVSHPHWQARVLTEKVPPARYAMTVSALARRELALGERVFYRDRTPTGLAVGWRSFAGVESGVAILRHENTPAARWLCDITGPELLALAEALRTVTGWYESNAVEDYNILIHQPPFGRRVAGRIDCPWIVLVPRGPGYQPAGFELLTDGRVQFISVLPEEEAREMGAIRGRV